MSRKTIWLHSSIITGKDVSLKPWLFYILIIWTILKTIIGQSSRSSVRFSVVQAHSGERMNQHLKSEKSTSNDIHVWLDGDPYQITAIVQWFEPLHNTSLKTQMTYLPNETFTQTLISLCVLILSLRTTSKSSIKPHISFCAIQTIYKDLTT